MRKLAPEVLKSDFARKYSGFYQKYMQGKGIDVGYRGCSADNVPVVDNAVGIDLGTPGYDGINIRWPDESLDFVFSSHCLEHLPNPMANIREWHRLVRVGGHVIVIVPHQHLYEKKSDLPSNWNADHKWFFTPGSLLKMVEEALLPNTYRVVHCRDNDVDYSYELGPDVHCGGACEIELVISKIKKPEWDILP